MTSMTTPAAVGEDTSLRIGREISEIISIYSQLYPAQRLNFILYAGKDPVWSAPEVIEGPFTFQPEHINADYLGMYEHPGIHADAPLVTVMLSIPCEPSQDELHLSGVPWMPRGWLRHLYRLSPSRYESVRFRTEMVRKRRCHRLHPNASLARGAGSPLLQAREQDFRDKRTAILIGMHWLEIGGAEKLALDTVLWALEAGLRVFVVASVPASQRLADRLPNHPDVIFLRLDRYLPHHLWPRYVENLARAENIRLVHIHHCPPLYDSLPQIRAKLPWIQVIDSTHIVEYSDGGFPRISGVWSNFIDIHHVISQDLVAYYRDNFEVTGKVRLGRMLDHDEDGNRTSLPETNLRPGQRDLHVIFIGRLYYQKRPVVVVEAFRALAGWARRNGVSLTGSIVGDGPFLPAVRSLLQRYHLMDMVSLLPGDSPVPEILTGSDILLLPSNNEGLALVCYEAIASGCIPISTDVGALREIIPQDLLVPLPPRACVRGIVDVVDKLWREPSFLSRQSSALAHDFSAVASDPTARQVLMRIYRDAARLEHSLDYR